MIRLHHQSQRTQEGLRLLAFPMEVHTNGHIGYGERRIIVYGCKRQFTILVAVPQDASFRKLYHLRTLNLGTFGQIRVVQRKGNLLTRHDAHSYLWLFHLFT